MTTTPPAAKPLLRALAGQANPTSPPPFWLMRQAGRYLPEYREVRARAGSFLNLCTAPALATEVTLQPLRRFGMDAAILFSDILVIPYALGQPLDYVEGEGPRLDPVRDGAAIARLDAGRLETALAPVYETVTRVRAALPADAALIGFAGAPWTVACYMVEGGGGDFAAVKQLAWQDPAAFTALIDLLVETTADHLLHQIRAGAEVVQIFDSWAGILPDDLFARWVEAPTARIVDRLRREAPGTPIIGFARGAGLLLRRYRARTGVDALGLDTTVPLAEASALQGQGTVQGNLDPVLLLTGGEALQARLRETLEALAPRPFIFNLGHGVLPATPIEHVALLAETIRRWSAAA